jgi:hypothetical protein
MKGTLISIVVGALAGVLLTVASNVHASRATASRAAPADRGIVTPAQTAVRPMEHPSDR